MSGFCCPICNQPLYEEEKSYFCPNGHCFDKAKSGYVNLLPVSLMHSKAPGDNKLMVQSRREFLNRGYYQKLSEQICRAAKSHLPEFSPLVLLDAGCGEGYYTHSLAETIKQIQKDALILGIDISKTAVSYAAKISKQASFAVGSVFHLPVSDHSISMLLNIFAPFCLPEFLRVLKPGGILLGVIPGARHLWELKKAVYEEPYFNEVKGYELEGLRFVEKQTLDTQIYLQTKEDISNLFRMTPYFYRTSKKAIARLNALEELQTQISFELLIYQKPE